MDNTTLINQKIKNLSEKSKKINKEYKTFSKKENIDKKKSINYEYKRRASVINASDDIKNYIMSREQNDKFKNLKKTDNKKTSKISKTNKTSKISKTNKSKNIIIINEKDVLKKYGYSNIKFLTIKQRRVALKKAIKNIKPLSVYRRLLALAILNKTTDPELSQILKNDSEWIKTQSEYINDKTIS